MQFSTKGIDAILFVTTCTPHTYKTGEEFVSLRDAVIATDERWLYPAIVLNLSISLSAVWGLGHGRSRTSSNMPEGNR